MADIESLGNRLLQNWVWKKRNQCSLSSIKSAEYKLGNYFLQETQYLTIKTRLFLSFSGVITNRAMPNSRLVEIRATNPDLALISSQGVVS